MYQEQFGVIFLPKDALACRLEQPGIKLPTFWLVDELLYLLSHSKVQDVLTFVNYGH